MSRRGMPVTVFQGQAATKLNHAPVRPLPRANRDKSSNSRALCLEKPKPAPRVISCHAHKPVVAAACATTAPPLPAGLKTGSATDLVRLKYFRNLENTLITAPDEVFMGKGVSFAYDDSQICTSELWQLFKKVGFYVGPNRQMQAFLDDACYLVWARPLGWPSTIPAPMMAAAFAMTDGFRSATLWNVCVDPEWQGQGLGRAVMERLMLQMMLQQRWDSITVLCEPAQRRFYERLGLLEDPNAEIII